MEIFPLFTQLLNIVLMCIGLYGLIITITATVEYHQWKKDDPQKAEEARQHVNRAFGIIVIAIILYLVINSIAPIFRLLF